MASYKYGARTGLFGLADVCDAFFPKKRDYLRVVYQLAESVKRGSGLLGQVERHANRAAHPLTETGVLCDPYLQIRCPRTADC